MADNKKMILNLFAGMQDALFLGDRFEKGEFVSFLQPGQFISQNLQENADSNDMAIQSEIANILVDSAFVNTYKDIDFSTGTELIGSVNQVYHDILNHTALPYKKLSQEIETEITQLRNWLSENAANYDLHRDQYNDIDSAYYNELHKQNPDQAILKQLSQKKIDAKKKWEVFGNKSTYENKYGRLTQLTAQSPEAFWASLRDKMERQKKEAPTGEEYYQTFLVPSIAQWNSSGWAHFKKEISERDTYEYSKNTSWKGKISGKWGLFSSGGGASGSSQYKHETSTVETVNLEFEYLRVRIYRPWLTSDVFGYNFWTWRNEFGGKYISDGGNLNSSTPIRPIGRMPILPQYLIVVRNVVLSANFSEEDKEFLHREIKAKASVGWGPFSVSGKYKESQTTKHFEASFDGTTFKINQPQIIARSGIMLPKNPNPNRALPWTGDACFPGSDCFTTEETLIDKIRETDYFMEAKSLGLL